MTGILTQVRPSQCWPKQAAMTGQGRFYNNRANKYDESLI
jgi:hypothetical protein